MTLPGRLQLPVLRHGGRHLGFRDLFASCFHVQTGMLACVHVQTGMLACVHVHPGVYVCKYLCVHVCMHNHLIVWHTMHGPTFRRDVRSRIRAALRADRAPSGLINSSYCFESSPEKVGSFLRLWPYSVCILMFSWRNGLSFWNSDRKALKWRKRFSTKR